MVITFENLHLLKSMASGLLKIKNKKGTLPVLILATRRHTTESVWEEQRKCEVSFRSHFFISLHRSFDQVPINVFSYATFLTSNNNQMMNERCLEKTGLKQPSVCLDFIGFNGHSIWVVTPKMFGWCSASHAFFWYLTMTKRFLHEEAQNVRLQIVFFLVVEY